MIECDCLFDTYRYKYEEGKHKNNLYQFKSLIFSVIKQFQGANYIFSGSTRNTVREIDYTIPKDDDDDNDDTYDDGDDDDEYK